MKKLSQKFGRLSFRSVSLRPLTKGYAHRCGVDEEIGRGKKEDH